MREIKFRAWSKGKHRMIMRANIISANVPEIQDEWEFMQYTGLHDKNGKEIYEGDIVKFYFCADHPEVKQRNNYCDPTEMIDTVEFEDGCFYLVNKDIGCGAYAFRWNERCEVIGNIYENPELLER